MDSGVEGYTGIDGQVKIKQEAVANMIGDYLFTDQAFVNRLAEKNPNIFQKMWNEVKYMVKQATAGSNEKKKLLEVQKAFEDAYQEAAKNAGKQSQEQKNTAEDGGVRYSLSNQTGTGFTSAEIHSIQSIGRKSINKFTAQDIAATEKFAQKYWEELGIKSPFYRAWFGDWRINDKTPIQIATKPGDTRGVQKTMIQGGISKFLEKFLMKQKYTQNPTMCLRESIFRT